MSYGLMPTAFNMTVLNHADLERMETDEIEERAKAVPLILSASKLPQEEIRQKLQDSLRIHYDRWVTGEHFDTKLHECVNERVDPAVAHKLSLLNRRGGLMAMNLQNGNPQVLRATGEPEFTRWKLHELFILWTVLRTLQKHSTDSMGKYAVLEIFQAAKANEARRAAPGQKYVAALGMEIAHTPCGTWVWGTGERQFKALIGDTSKSMFEIETMSVVHDELRYATSLFGVLSAP